MQEHELWITRLFNDHLAGVGNCDPRTLRRSCAQSGAALGQFHHDGDSGRADHHRAVRVCCARSCRWTSPASCSISSKLIYEFLQGQAEEQIEHHGHRYLAFFGTLFIFILFCNLIGIIPGFRIADDVPVGHGGLRDRHVPVLQPAGHQGAWASGKYLAAFAGPSPLLAPLMFPIEIISTLARPLSLTIRLYANMFAGEQVTVVFLGLTYLVAPAVFMGLHVFVSFLQAYVFTLLTMIYVGGAIAHEH